MKTLCFELTMPNRGSWNGRWSGEGNYYAIIRKFSKGGKQKSLDILNQKSYYYRWDDGWSASISVREVLGKEITQIKRKSNGFCGYDWMVDSIIDKGKIET
ncbi:MAG: hypothetical protein AABY22_11280, partial [Nanoarchaeota archaeon]